MLWGQGWQINKEFCRKKCNSIHSILPLQSLGMQDKLNIGTVQCSLFQMLINYKLSDNMDIE